MDMEYLRCMKKGVRIEMDLPKDYSEVLEAFWASKAVALASIALGEDSLSKFAEIVSPRGYKDRILLVTRLAKCLALGPHHRIFIEGRQTIGGPLHKAIIDTLLAKLQKMVVGSGDLVGRVHALKSAYIQGYIELWERFAKELSPEEMKLLVLGYSTSTTVNMLSDLFVEDQTKILRGYLVLVDVKRVMEYIGESRRPRDMMISSLLASISTWASIRELVSTYGPDILLIPFPPSSKPAAILALNSISSNAQDVRVHEVGIIAKTPAQMLLLLPGASKLYEGLFKSAGLEANIQDPNSIKEGIKKIISNNYENFWRKLLEESAYIARIFKVDEEVIRDLKSLNPEPPLPLKVEIAELKLEIKDNIFLKDMLKDTSPDLCLRIFNQNPWSLIDSEIRKTYREEIFIEKGRPIVANLRDLTYKDYRARRIRRLCSICGSLPAIFEWERHGRYLRNSAIISEGENLCIYCFTKRMLSTVSGLISIYRASLGDRAEYMLKLHRKTYRSGEIITQAAIPIAPSTSDIAIQGVRKKLVELFDKIEAEDLRNILENLRKALTLREALKRMLEDVLPEPEDISHYTYDLLRKLKREYRKRYEKGELSKIGYRYLKVFLSKSVEELLEKPMILKAQAGIDPRRYEKMIIEFRKYMNIISTKLQEIFNKHEISPLEVGRGFPSYYAIIYSDMDNGGRVKRGELVVSRKYTQNTTRISIPPSCDGEVKGRDIGNGYEVYEICMTFSIIHLYSASLIMLADEAEKKILEAGGWPIYIGGDDVIALSNVGIALDIAQALRDSMLRSSLLLDIVPEPTRSTSILISHYKNPLYMAFVRAKEFLEKAKSAKLIDSRSNIPVKAKDSVAISILFKGMAVEPDVVIIPHVIEGPMTVGKGDGGKPAKIKTLPIVKILADCVSRGASRCLSQSIYRDYRRNLATIEEIHTSIISGGKDYSGETFLKGLKLLIEINSPVTKRSQITVGVEDLLISTGIYANYVIAVEDKTTGIVRSILDSSEILLRGIGGYI